jgi:preprotein translocase subunit YajC
VASFDHPGPPYGGSDHPDLKNEEMFMPFVNLLAMGSPNAGEGGASSMLSFLPLVLIFIVFWFMIIRPQKKQQDQRKSMIGALKRGDQIITSGGLFATVKDVKGDRVVATIADGVKVEISKGSINSVVEVGE